MSSTQLGCNIRSKASGIVFLEQLTNLTYIHRPIPYLIGYQLYLLRYVDVDLGVASPPKPRTLNWSEMRQASRIRWIGRSELSVEIDGRTCCSAPRKLSCPARTLGCLQTECKQSRRCSLKQRMSRSLRPPGYSLMAAVVGLTQMEKYKTISR